MFPNRTFTYIVEFIHEYFSLRGINVNGIMLLKFESITAIKWEVCNIFQLKMWSV